MIDTKSFYTRFLVLGRDRGNKPPMPHDEETYANSSNNQDIKRILQYDSYEAGTIARKRRIWVSGIKSKIRSRDRASINQLGRNHTCGCMFNK